MGRNKDVAFAKEFKALVLKKMKAKKLSAYNVSRLADIDDGNFWRFANTDSHSENITLSKGIRLVKALEIDPNELLDMMEPHF